MADEGGIQMTETTVDVTKNADDAEQERVQEMATDAKNAFAVAFTFLQVIIVVIFYTGTQYGNFQAEQAAGNAGQTTAVSTFYSFYSDVALMVWVGFGFLMTFLRKYGFSAVGFNMLISCFVFEWSVLVMGFFHLAAANNWSNRIEVNISLLIEGCFGAACVMITFGALLGKVSPTQLLLISFIEVIIYGLNFYIGSLQLKALDMGGSMFVHMFGAYFGVGCALTLRHPDQDAAKKHKYNGSSYQGDMTAMIGTIFLWVLWPSFNGALAPAGSQYRVVINTVLALNSSCIGAFIFSRLLSKDGKFDMVHIQNATLAGGVAVGSSADLVIGPGAGLTVGFIGGALSVVGYVYITPALENALGLDDTCGVHNLHGLPGLLGGISGVISTATATTNVYGTAYSTLFGAGRSPSNQPLFQLAALGITLAMSFFGGLLTGYFTRVLTNCIPGLQDHGEFPNGFYEDAQYWEVPQRTYKRM